MRRPNRGGTAGKSARPRSGRLLGRVFLWGAARARTTRKSWRRDMSDETKFVEELGDRDDFSQWYLDLVYKAGLADESPVRGSMIIKPYGYALWENMQQAMDARIKATRHEHLYFPPFIPYTFLDRAAAHVEGFAPAIPLLTRAGG